ncbi:hypothetical protein CISIN_1g045899mg [Citrus sinensis]|uniref:AP2/ERF domain-containing protein n=1 Tax=Citrus sinensis TaxID=2711 RepID=A0A067E6U3_CITSI|nr:hypothetical protein CISIN_1g045899mg [Citrus sinensis]
MACDEEMSWSLSSLSEGRMALSNDRASGGELTQMHWGDLPLKEDDSENMVVFRFLRDVLTVGWVPQVQQAEADQGFQANFLVADAEALADQSATALALAEEKCYRGVRLRPRGNFRVAGLGFGSELSRRLRRRLLAYDQAAFGMRGSRAHLNFPLLFRVSRAGHNEVRASVSVNG